MPVGGGAAHNPRIAGVVAEYNPFHRGHAFHLAQTRAAGATHIVCVMSGQFAQRGEPALLSKRWRTAMALAGGADLVLELPLPWALASAEHFARGAVALLAGLGCVDMLSFGSECGDAALLGRASAALASAAARTALRTALDGGASYPAARQTALAQAADAVTARVLDGANDTLGVSYLLAAEALGWSPDILAVPRAGGAHDGGAAGGYASATWLRAAADGGSCPADAARLERGMLARLRLMEAADWAKVAGVGVSGGAEGLSHRLRAAVRRGGTLAEVLALAGTRRYPQSRLRRAVWSAYLGVPAGMAEGTPPYARVLGLTPAGGEVLALAKRRGVVPPVSRGGDMARRAPSLWALEQAAGEVYALLLPQAPPAGEEWRYRVVKHERGAD